MRIDYNLWQKLEREISLIDKEKEFIDREIDYLTYICNEMEKDTIAAEEEEKLTDIKRKLQSQDKEIQLIESIINDIHSSAIDQVNHKSPKKFNKNCK